MFAIQFPPASIVAMRSAFAGFALVCAGLGFAASAAAQAIYTYTGNPFTQFSCGASSGGGVLLCATPAPTNLLTTYIAADKVTATLSLASPLPANLALADVSILPGFQLTMNDGRHTVTNAMAVGFPITLVSTDTSGVITNWRLILNTGGADNGGIATQNFVNATPTLVMSDSGTLRCCDPATADLARNSGTPGTWTAPPASPAAAVASLITLVNTTELGLNVGQVASLTDALNNILAAIETGQNKRAIRELKSLIRSVESAQRKGTVLPTTADTLIAAANAIIAML